MEMQGGPENWPGPGLGGGGVIVEGCQSWGGGVLGLIFKKRLMSEKPANVKVIPRTAWSK